MTNGESFAPVVLFKLLIRVYIFFRPIRTMKNNFLYSDSRTVRLRLN